MRTKECINSLGFFSFLLGFTALIFREKTCFTQDMKKNHRKIDVKKKVKVFVQTHVPTDMLAESLHVCITDH